MPAGVGGSAKGKPRVCSKCAVTMAPPADGFAGL